jgi:hypothetical protein
LEFQSCLARPSQYILHIKPDRPAINRRRQLYLTKAEEAADASSTRNDQGLASINAICPQIVGHP